MLKAQVNERQNDANGEDPFRNVKWDQLSRLDFGGPPVKDEELDSSEGINAVDSD